MASTRTRFAPRPAMVLATVLPIGCAPHMKVPADLDDAVVLDVAGRTPDRFAGDELSFGSYHADSVSRGYTSSFVDRDFFGKALDEIRSYPEDDSFSYRLSDGEHDFHAVCTAAPQRTEMPGFTSTTTHHLQCVCAAKEPQRVVQLSLAGEDDVLRGVLSQPSASYSGAGTPDLPRAAPPAQNPPRPPRPAPASSPPSTCWRRVGSGSIPACPPTRPTPSPVRPSPSCSTTDASPIPDCPPSPRTPCA